MKLNVLINELNKIQANYGNLEVVIDDIQNEVKRQPLDTLIVREDDWTLGDTLVLKSLTNEDDIIRDGVLAEITPEIEHKLDRRFWL